MSAIPWWYTELGGELERDALMHALAHRNVSMGPRVRALEGCLGRLLEVPHVVLTPSGTAALAMALLASGVQPGDEVIVPDLTWIATANAAAILGAKVVLADCGPDLPLMDPNDVARLLTPRTKAIVPVHFNGRPCAMPDLIALAQPRGITVVEDACKALTSRAYGRSLGTIGQLGCYSLGMVSLISMGYGGAVVTRDRVLHRRLLAIRAQGVPDLDREAYVTLGFNFKVSDLLASLGAAQCLQLDAKQNHVLKIYETYAEGLAGHPDLQILPVDTAAGQVPLLVEGRTSHRTKLLAHLASQQIQARPFHLPLHEAPWLGGQGAFPNAEAFSRDGFILPCGPSQPLENVHRCIEALRAWRA